MEMLTWEVYSLNDAFLVATQIEKYLRDQPNRWFATSYENNSQPYSTPPTLVVIKDPMKLKKKH